MLILRIPTWVAYQLGYLQREVVVVGIDEDVGRCLLVSLQRDVVG